MTVQKSLVVTSTAYEVRAALLEDGAPVELFIERLRHRGMAGNIYKGRVKKVLPGMQSAFVDIGVEKDAFLYVADVDDGRDRPSRDELRSSVEGRGDSEGGDVTGTYELVDVGPPIEQRLSEGQEILVQVAKEPMAGKGARITTHVTLPGRYLVYLPSVRHVGVSRRLDSVDERARLKAIAERLRDAGTGGFIVRTAGQAVEETEFVADADYLRGLWTKVSARAEEVRAPGVVHSELGLLDKLLRDLVAGDFGEIVVDDEADYQRCVEFLSRMQPQLAGKVRMHVQREALFDAYGIEAAIQKSLRSKVWLRNGGYLVINQTEALVAIDVNTGRYVGKVGLEDTALRTNLEAVREVVRQLRLRDLGGIIVVDFIDMGEVNNRERVVRELEEALKSDRSKSKILKLSDFGLVEMTRKRVKQSLERLLLRPCTHCGGGGRVKSDETMAYEIHRELLKSRDTLPSGAMIEIRVHPEVGSALRGAYQQTILDLERELGAKVIVREDATLHVEHFDFMVP